MLFLRFVEASSTRAQQLNTFDNRRGSVSHGLEMRGAHFVRPRRFDQIDQFACT